MGDTFQTIVDRDASPQDAPNLARPVVEWLVTEGIVVAVYTEHHFFYSPHSAGPHTVTCPRCTTAGTEEGDLAERFGTAISTWYETGVADAECPACAATVPLSAWRWSDDVLAFGFLGFEFWNWPPLSEEFRTRVAALLPGHSTTYLMGKI